MKNPSKKKSPVGKIGATDTKTAKFMPKKPLKDGMASPKVDKMMSKIDPDDAKPSYKGTKDKPSSASAGKMKALGKTALFRKKGNKR